MRSCPCCLATPPTTHAVASAKPPFLEKHEQSQIDVTFFESTPFLHVNNPATSWPESGRLRSRAMSDRCAMFLRLWIYQHGPQKLLQANKKYNNTGFRKLCSNWNIKLQIVAANHYKANNEVERANRTLRMAYNRLAQLIAAHVSTILYWKLHTAKSFLVDLNSPHSPNYYTRYNLAFWTTLIL